MGTTAGASQARGQPGLMQVSTTEKRSPIAINLANFLRDNKGLKARVGLINNNTDVDFFKYKRLKRLLLSDEYKQKQKNPKNGLVPINTNEDAERAFVMLIQNQMIIPVQKLHYAEIKAIRGWKPNKQKPTLKRIDKATVEPMAYFAWTYLKPNPYMILYGLLTIVGVFAVILFPLWPIFMKRGVWYLSMGALGLIGCFFGIAIIRLIIYLITLVTMLRAFWLFPNLFEDCGVIESFQPTYGWEEPKKSKKSKKSKSKKITEVTDSEPSAVALGAQPNANGTTKHKVVLEEVAE
jgi:translocation protein SEC62